MLYVQTVFVTVAYELMSIELQGFEFLC